MEKLAAGRYAGLGNPERTVINVSTLFREFSGKDSPHDVANLFALMAKLT